MNTGVFEPRQRILRHAKSAASASRHGTSTENRRIVRQEPRSLPVVANNSVAFTAAPIEVTFSRQWALMQQRLAPIDHILRHATSHVGEQIRGPLHERAAAHVHRQRLDPPHAIQQSLPLAEPSQCTRRRWRHVRFANRCRAGDQLSQRLRTRRFADRRRSAAPLPGREWRRLRR